ncbi:MAG TPA: hypothetical protein PKW08_01395 [Flavobacteriaceae bacterium]|nr:hypothetical protein [Flavobacteriaceae bacterium]MCB9212467.1 hypothetical protein [Alteromonas sp.]HPF10530.1 hypothetical protein [Flavobacteriaceae bacterium]HQU20218.1 hypothetical protein [Flavobacteriaceae bacterium]HQU66040.1 hypothetical protein [Flavobacteriaceae bacterium]
MELAKIETLLEAYFEGNTTLQEETQLQAFFASADVPTHLEPYAPLFVGLKISRDEQLVKPLVLPKTNNRSNFWKWSIAATIAVILGVFGFLYFQDDGLTKEQQEALMAYNKAKEAMLLLSENLNKGASKITYIQAFEEGTSTLGLVNQFTETKNQFFK